MFIVVIIHVITIVRWGYTPTYKQGAPPCRNSEFTLLIYKWRLISFRAQCFLNSQCMVDTSFFFYSIVCSWFTYPYLYNWGLYTLYNSGALPLIQAHLELFSPIRQICYPNQLYLIGRSSSMSNLQGLVNVLIEHHPNIGGIIFNRYLKVMWNKSPK